MSEKITAILKYDEGSQGRRGMLFLQHANDQDRMFASRMTDLKNVEEDAEDLARLIRAAGKINEASEVEIQVEDAEVLGVLAQLFLSLLSGKGGAFKIVMPVVD